MLAAKTGTSSCRTATSQRWILAFALVAIAGVDPGAAQNACTVIDTLPVTITTPGGYCLDRNLLTPPPPGIPDQASISIQASNVVIDCRGHDIEGPNTWGVSGLVGARNLTVRNCRLVSFQLGIDIEEDAVVEDNEIVGSGSIGIVAGRTGGRALIRRNRVLDTGSPVNNPAAVSRGIMVFSESEVVDNLVSGVFVGQNPNNANGILSLGFFNPTFPGGNTIRGNVVRDIQGTTAHAILGAPRDVIRDNQIINTTTSAVVGIKASGALCRDNDIVRFTGVSCGLSSGNVLLP